jgi:3-keto-L-gulonate-6-phosphate decarboxylase
MKLQISFDLTDLDKAIEIAQSVVNQCDIFEISTILLCKYGIQAVTRFRNTFPHKPLIVDTKLVDSAEPIIPMIAQAGANWITVLAGSTQETIHALCKEASKHNLKVLLDLVDSSYKGQSAMEAKNLGADALLFHQPYSPATSLTFIDTWEMVKGNASLPIFISAEINRENVNRIMLLKPQTLIIGRSIVQATDPAQEAQFYYDLIVKD